MVCRSRGHSVYIEYVLTHIDIIYIYILECYTVLKWMLSRKHNFTKFIKYCYYVNLSVHNISIVACDINCKKCTVKGECTTGECKEGYVVKNKKCVLGESFYG